MTHFYKFLRIADGESPIGKVRPAPQNPKAANFPAALRPVSHLFNALYRYAFFTLDEFFSTSGDKGALIGRLYRLMGEMMGPVALYLMNQPNAGPTFEIFDLGPEPRSRLQSLADEVSRGHPALGHVTTSLESL